tara:strand:+ start:2701 stop:3453 length:753 start_codon:yes stop_codon:yes gene_type:complete
MNEEVQEAETTTELPPQEQRDFVVAEDLENKTDDRPEWLPEKYKTGEDLAKAYKELESKLGAKDLDIRNELLKEIQEESFKGRPSSANEYQLPDFVDTDSIDTNDETLRWWADHAFSNGLDQEEFAEGLQKVMEAQDAYLPDPEEELKKLGDNANVRVEAVDLFARQFFPEEYMESIEDLAATAEGVKALEFIMAKLQSPAIGSDATPIGRVTEEGLREMMADERYWHPARRNTDFVKQVDEGFQKLHNQ